MTYRRAGTSTSSTSAQAVQVHVSSLAFGTSVRVPSMQIAVRRIVYSPQAGQGRPGAFVEAEINVCGAVPPVSSAAMRASSASTRSGAPFMRLHSDHLSSVDRIVGKTAANAGRAKFNSPRRSMKADGADSSLGRQHDTAFMMEMSACASITKPVPPRSLRQ